MVLENAKNVEAQVIVLLVMVTMKNAQIAMEMDFALSVMQMGNV
jgi:hypothetical protein